MKFVRKKTGIILIVTAAVLLTAGAFLAVRHSRRSSGDNAIYSTMQNTLSDQGFYHQAIGPSQGIYYFFDFTSQKDVLWTDKPNGTEEDTRFPNSPQNLAAYGGKIYAFSLTSVNTTTLYSADPDGSNKKEFLKLKTANPTSAVFYKDKIYYASSVGIYKNNDTNGSEETAQASIHVIDLNKKTDQALTQTRTAIGAGYYFLGEYNNRLYYTYRDQKAQLDTSKVSQEDMLAYIKSILGKFELYEYNLSSGKAKQVTGNFEATDNMVQSHGCIYYIHNDSSTHINTLYKLEPGTGKSTGLISDKNLVASLDSAGDYIVCSIDKSDGSAADPDSGTYTVCYDVNSGKSYKVSSEYPGGVTFSIMYGTPGGFIGQYSKAGTSTWAYISQKDFFAGKDSFTPFK